MGQLLLNVPYETGLADPESYAGARVLRMILASLGANPIPVEQMYNHAHALNDPNENWPYWYIDPGAMLHTLNDFDPRGPGNWVIYQETVPADADSQLQGTLATYQVAAATLVNAGRHWVCVIGYTWDNNTNQRTGFYVNDPAYSGGGAQQWYSTATWDTAYTPVGGGIKWLGQITEVGDPRPVEDVLEPTPRRIVRSGDMIIAPEEAIELAIEGARKQLSELPALRRAIAEGRPGQPRLVARLDQEGSYYYLVPFEANSHDGTVIAAIMVDARFGDILSASAAEEPFRLWPVVEDEARELVTRAPIPVYEPAETAAGPLLDAILAARCEGVGSQRLSERLEAEAAERLSLREMVTAALGSVGSARTYLSVQLSEIAIDPVWAWHPCGGISPYHPYYVIRSPWRNIYVNAHTGIIRLHFDLCRWSPLGA